MKSLILACLFTATSLLAQGTPDTAPKPELFRDPVRKVKNAKGEIVTANLQPLFSWYRSRRGDRPMQTWDRFAVATVQNTSEGIVVENSLDKKIFFLRNYPYQVPVKSVIHFFAIDDGFHTYKDANGAEHTVHAVDYGAVPKPEQKAAPRKPSTPASPPK